MINEIDYQKAKRKPGRPRAIPESLIPEVISLYHHGFGYRSIARQLKDKGISVDWSTIRRIIKNHTTSNQHP
jgi:hypothetical protein